MKKIYVAFFSILTYAGFAQQDIQFTQYMFNKIYYNPGVTGSGSAICVNAFHRSQWVGFEGAPTSQSVNINAPINKLHGGLALRIANDQIGFFQNINFGLNYGYQFKNIMGGTLGLGIGVDVYNSAIKDAIWITPSSLGGGTDTGIPQDKKSGTSVDVSFGAYFENSDWWAGISSTHLAETSSSIQSAAGGDANYAGKRHLYAMGGYNYDLTASNITLQPSLLIKSDLVSSPVVDVNIMALYNKKLWAGVTYRLTEAVGINVGYQIMKSLKAGYAYDVPLTEVSQQGGGSHEIFLNYCFKIEIPVKPHGYHKTIRFL